MCARLAHTEIGALIHERARRGVWRIAPELMADRARRFEREVRLREGVTGLASRLPPEVADGPFAGMRMPADRLADVDAPVAKLVGSYELELHPSFEAALDAGLPFVDIGSADGYFAVGMALRGATVVAFEIAKSARELCLHIAALNDVTVDQRAAYDGAEVGNALVLCDVEGAERKLFTPSVVRGMRAARVLVEVHEHQGPGLSARLVSAFSASHDVERIDQAPRPGHPALEGWAPEEVRAALYEHRPVEMHWLSFTPRSPSAAS